MARGEAWEKSDIDLTIILRDGQERATGYRTASDADLETTP